MHKSNQNLKLLVNALVISRLDSCTSIGPLKQELDKLQRIQNATARLIGGTNQHQHITPVFVN